MKHLKLDLTIKQQNYVSLSTQVLKINVKISFIEQNESLIKPIGQKLVQSMTLITFCFLIPKEHYKKISLNRHFPQKKTRSYTLSAVYQTNGQVNRALELAGQVKKLLFSFDKILKIPSVHYLMYCQILTKKYCLQKQ